MSKDISTSPAGPKVPRFASFKGRYKGRRWYLVPVLVRLNDSQTLESRSVEFRILAAGPADAANYVLAAINRPETEVFAWGPKGGRVHRYSGWYAYIARNIGSALNVERLGI